MNINTLKVNESRSNQVDPKDIKFGSIYSDHMLVANYSNGTWHAPEIIPYDNLILSPSTTFMHYGQAIFEGIKAYKNGAGEIRIFRPEDNWHRFNKSAWRMGMPEVPENIFMEGMRQLIELDKDWVPDGDGCSLYIRPFMIGVDEFIGVKPAEKFKFLIITSPAGAYYADPIKIYVHEKYTRAANGGVGEAKAAGNYGAAMMPTMEVRKLGYDQILWTDAVHHKFVQEIGTMNVFFVLNGEVYTPDLTGGTILDGVTRKSVITVLKDMGYKVHEQAISIDDLAASYDKGEFTEAFGAGTAAVVAPIKELHIHGKDMVLPALSDASISSVVKKALADIRYGRAEDKYEWMYKVC